MNSVTVNVNTTTNTTTNTTGNQVFNFGDYQVRTVIKEGEPWFVAKDVCSVLEYRSANDMTRNLDDEEKDTQVVRTLGGEQLVSVINESGLYSAILKSRKPEAKAFKKWLLRRCCQVSASKVNMKSRQVFLSLTLKLYLKLVV